VRRGGLGLAQRRRARFFGHVRSAWCVPLVGEGTRAGLERAAQPGSGRAPRFAASPVAASFLLSQAQTSFGDAHEQAVPRFAFTEPGERASEHSAARRFGKADRRRSAALSTVIPRSERAACGRRTSLSGNRASLDPVLRAIASFARKARCAVERNEQGASARRPRPSLRREARARSSTSWSALDAPSCSCLVPSTAYSARSVAERQGKRASASSLDVQAEAAPPLRPRTRPTLLDTPPHRHTDTIGHREQVATHLW